VTVLSSGIEASFCCTNLARDCRCGTSLCPCCSRRTNCPATRTYVSVLIALRRLLGARVCSHLTYQSSKNGTRVTTKGWLSEVAIFKSLAQQHSAFLLYLVCLTRHGKCL
jgi:hypothetical protein